MFTFIIGLCAVVYLAFGALVAFLISGTFDIKQKWIALPLIALFWPLAALLPLYAIVSWMKNGSH